MIKKTHLLSIFLLLFVLAAFSQQIDSTFKPSLKYGKPSMEELTMTAYAPDTSAAAVVLYSKCDVHYDFIVDNFRIGYTCEIKIKVLKSNGSSYADIQIPYYSNERASSIKETVFQIEASAYNLEEGEIVRTKMKRNLIFEERIDGKNKQIKFSIPAVREGTVLEYKYQLQSDFYYIINPWKAQRDIPVIYAQYDVAIPEYFRFNLDVRGFHPLTSKEEPASFAYNIQYQNGQRERIDCSGRHLQFTAEHLPALRTDSYVWCADDYLSSVRFELKGLDFPGALYRSFGNTWTDIDKMLLEDENFGSLLKMRNPYREEMATLALDTLADRHKKISAIYSFLKKKISWNNQYRIYGDEVKKAIKNGTGSNADINFVLMSMLRDANIPCYPVVMSRKTMGILPYTHPSIQKLNTFVVGIADTDNTFVFLDGSVNNGIDVLPPALMVDRARLVTKAGENNWVDLSKLGQNQLRASINAQIHADGKISGTRNTRYLGQYAADFRKRYYEAKDSMEYVSKLETEEDVKIKNFRTEELELFSPRLTESFEYEKQATVNDDLIYVNPLIFMHIGKCPFIQAERKLPLEMPHPEHVQLAAQLTLPEGYAVEELPKPMFFVTEDGQGSCKYNVNQLENKITTTYTFVFNKLLTAPNEYEGIKRFWETVVEKNNEILVLKKL